MSKNQHKGGLTGANEIIQAFHRIQKRIFKKKETNNYTQKRRRGEIYHLTLDVVHVCHTRSFMNCQTRLSEETCVTEIQHNAAARSLLSL